MDSELKDALKRGGCERTEEGVYFPAARVLARGVFSYGKRGEEPILSENLLVDEGLTHMLASALGGATQLPSWYIAIFGGNVTPLGSWDAATFAATATELTAYNETTRVPWTPTTAAANVISSFTAKATFTANATITVRGAALLSASAKSTTTGVLMGASRFPLDKGLADTEILDVGYQVELTPV